MPRNAPSTIDAAAGASETTSVSNWTGFELARINADVESENWTSQDKNTTPQKNPPH